MAAYYKLLEPLNVSGQDEADAAMHSVPAAADVGRSSRQRAGAGSDGARWWHHQAQQQARCLCSVCALVLPSVVRLPPDMHCLRCMGQIRGDESRPTNQGIDAPETIQWHCRVSSATG